MLIPFMFSLYGFAWNDDGTEGWFLPLFVIPFLIGYSVLNILAIAGGILALKKERYGLALAFAICGAIPSSLMGILATVFIAMSRDEFKQYSR